jgi:hypothetical protein
LRRLTKIGIVLASITAVEIAVFQHYNSLLNTKPAVAADTDTKHAASTGIDVTGFKPFLDNRFLTVSNDHSRFAYIDSHNVLRVEDISTHKEIYSLQLLIKPVYLRWVNDDMLFIGTEIDNGGTKDLRLSTLDITSGTLRLIQSFAGFAPDSTFKQISFSSYTNDVYVLIGNQYNSALYHFDTNGTVNRVYLGGRYVSNVGVTSTTGELYFQDFAEGTKNVLINTNSEVHLIQRNAILLRVSRNVLYYGVLNSNGMVTSVAKYQNQSSTTVATLPTPVDPSKILLTEDDEVVVLSDSAYKNLNSNQTVSLPAGAETLVKDNCLFIIRPNKVSIVM